MNHTSVTACWAPEGALLLPGQADLAPSSQRLDSSKNAHGVLRGRGRFEDLKRHAGDISSVGIYASVCPSADPKIDTAATPPGSSSLSVTDSVETVTGPPKPSLTYIPPKFGELQLKHEGFGGPGGNRTLVRNREDDLSSHERYTPHC